MQINRFKNEYQCQAANAAKRAENAARRSKWLFH
jgi:hypothetical protein